MTFTSPPDYDAQPKLTDFMGRNIILEPVRKALDQSTKYGPSDYWDCIVWVPNREGGLDATAGIRVYASRMVASLDVAHRTNAPMVGRVARIGNGTALEEISDSDKQLLGELWNNNSDDPHF